MTISTLRKKHPTFIYQSYTYHWSEDSLNISFSFKIEPDIVFTPEITIKGLQKREEHSLDSYVFNLGMIEAISYWKSTCSPEFVVQAGYLHGEQLHFWNDVYRDGLGEFYFVNDIDFTDENFFRFTIDHTEEPNNLHAYNAEGALILASGGKDSSVTLELLKDLPMSKEVMVLNPLPAAYRVVREAGYEDLVVCDRVIDPKLIELNTQGYLNGHTPFSAYLSFLGFLVASIQKKLYVIASNERSSSEGNTQYRGMTINHQYSKSFDYEQKVNAYVSTYLTNSTSYFSFLRPLHDIQVTQLFSTFTQYHTVFRSCNVNQKKDSWCKQCAKCAFVYLSLFPFLSFEQMMSIFGSDLFEDPVIVNFIHDIVTPGKVKPLECVGTERESFLAVCLSAQKYIERNSRIPDALARLMTTFPPHLDTIIEDDSILLKEWSDDHLLPEIFVQILKKATHYE